MPEFWKGHGHGSTAHPYIRPIRVGGLANPLTTYRGPRIKTACFWRQATVLILETSAALAVHALSANLTGFRKATYEFYDLILVVNTSLIVGLVFPYKNLAARFSMQVRTLKKS
ncbi:hypothetical protein CHS0354_004100 [Potamilus streckersoni]|uniref:Uncharacterized protein n=1 Tax=Potamilus streckersoni TaxID=2493646 RepID=A0AAE0VWP5_9BIVA|nr:hypothetical protein CHS0354_004100 [Potamilus streckersoni]